MFKIGDIVSYTLGNGVFKGEVVDMTDEVLIVVSEGGEPFNLPVVDATLVDN